MNTRLVSAISVVALVAASIGGCSLFGCNDDPRAGDVERAIRSEMSALKTLVGRPELEFTEYDCPEDRVTGALRVEDSEPTAKDLAAILQRRGWQRGPGIPADDVYATFRREVRGVPGTARLYVDPTAKEVDFAVELSD
jgi:hypothetical protein